MKLLTFFFGFSIFIIFPLVHGLLPKKEASNIMKLKNYKVCEDHTNTVMKITDLRVVCLSKDQYVLTATTIIQEDMPAPLYIRMKVQKCQDNKGSDTCVYMMDKEYPDFCKDLLNPKSKAYDLMNNTLNIPNPRCPLPKGTYPLKSKPFDAGDSGDKAAMIGKIWKLEIYILKEDASGNKVPAVCINLDAVVEAKPKKEKSRNWGV